MRQLRPVLPDTLVRIIDQATSPNPEQRFASAAELEQARQKMGLTEADTADTGEVARPLSFDDTEPRSAAEAGGDGPVCVRGSESALGGARDTTPDLRRDHRRW